MVMRMFDQQQQVDAAGNCFFMGLFCSKHDNTVIEIIPSVLTRLGKPAGVPFTVTLNKGEIYQIIGPIRDSGNGNQCPGPNSNP